MQGLQETNEELYEKSQHGTDDSTEKRIQKLESSICLLGGIVIGHVLAEFISALLQSIVG